MKTKYYTSIYFSLFEMKNLCIKLLSFTILLLITSCQNEINNPDNAVEQNFKFDGYVTHNNLPLANIEVILNTNKCFTDSNGYFYFDSLNNGNKLLKIIHPKFIPIDTLLNITNNITLTFELKNRSNSFFPLKIGNKWNYNNITAEKPDSTEYELVVEVKSIEQKDNMDFYRLLYTDTSPDLIDTSSYSRYYMMKNDSLYEYRCDTILLLAVFNKPVNHNFQNEICNITFNVKIFEKSDVFTKFSYWAVNVFDADFALSFQKGIGITRHFNAWKIFELGSYEIQY